MDEYGVKVVWIGTILGEATEKEFEDWFKEEHGFKVKYEEEFVMVDGYYKDFHCTVFGLHKDDVARFCVFRLMTNDMKWIDDFIENERLGVPMHIIKKYADDDLYKELMCSECNKC